MRSMIRRWGAAFGVVVLAACGVEEPTGTAGEIGGEDAIAPALLIATKSGFQFLPPMVRTEGPRTGSFDPDRAMTVRIVCVRATGRSCPELARLSTTSGGLTVDRAEEYYRGRWRVPTNLETGADRYLLQVLDEEFVIAEAGLWAVATRGLLSVVRPSHVGVVRGGSLEIRFRVEVGTVGATRLVVSPASAIMAPGEAVPLTATFLSGRGPVTWSTSAPGVATVAPDGRVTATGPGTAEVMALANGRQAAATISVLPLPGPASATFGRQGGAAEVQTTNGGRLTLTVPSGAVEDPTLFRIRPLVRTGPESARFGFTPGDQPFPVPILLAYHPPAGTTLSPRALLSWTGPAGRMLQRLIPDPSLNRWLAATRLVGTLPPLPPLAGAATPLVGPQRAEGQEGGRELELTVEETITAAEILEGGRAALAWFLSDPSLQTADMLMRTIDVVAPSPYDPTELLARDTFLEEWRTAVCAAGLAAVVRYAGLSVNGWDIPDFIRETELLTAWAAVAEQTTLTNELRLPFDGCAGGQPPFRAKIAEKADDFAPLIEALVNPPGRDLGVRFDEVIDTHLRRLIDVTGYFRFVGVESYVPALASVPREMFNALRRTAWQSCRDRRDQVRLARVMELELGGAEELSSFTEEDLAADIAGCTTELEWRTRPVESGGGYGQLELSGLLATSGLGQPTPAGSLGLRTRRALILAGRVQPLTCPGNPAGTGASLNGERLEVRVRYGVRIETLAMRDVPSSLGLVYLQSDSVVVTYEQIGQAVGEDDWGEAELSVWRTGQSCADIFSALPSESQLGVLTVTQEGIGVTVTPSQVTVAPDGEVGFTATVTNSTQGVAWEVTGGTITTSGNSITYTAGAVEGPYLVIARSLEAPDEAADTATVTIEAQCPAPGVPAPAGMARAGASCVTIAVSPTAAALSPGQTLQFSATVAGSANTAVTWSASGGSITSGGLYTAGSGLGSFSVTATSVADPTVSAAAAVTIGAAPPPPTPSVGLQIVSLFSAGKPLTPVRYRSRVTNLPGVTVQWTYSAVGNGSGYMPMGPLPPNTVTFSPETPVQADQYRVDWFATLAYPTNWAISSAVTIGVTFVVRACYFQANGQPVRNSFGDPLCQEVVSGL